MTDYAYSTATELIDAMSAGQVTSVELVSSAIQRIERFDDVINAVPVRDFERALASAEKADAARARGQGGPLLGVPVTVKESFNVEGLPTTWGLPPFRDFQPSTDAVAVTRLKRAGAVVLGKTNVPVALGDMQTYNPIHGVTRNPWDLDRTPGGSSGGSAAALAAGFGAVSIASDIAGSLRVPAHFSGVYAHKPSSGLLPARGHSAPPALPLEYARDLTVVGPMARGAADLSLLLGLLAGPDEAGAGMAYRLALPPARHENLASYRILVVDEHPFVPTSADVRVAMDQLASGLSRAGAKVVSSSSLLPDLIEGSRLFMRLLLASLAAVYPPDVYEQSKQAADRLPAGDISLAAERTRGTNLSYRDWITTDAERVRHRAEWSNLFAEFDVVLCPPAPTTAFPHDHTEDMWSRTLKVDGAEIDYADQLVWAGLATMPGLPATVAPIATTADGLPTGVQIIGPMFEDQTPLHVAQLIEREFGGLRTRAL